MPGRPAQYDTECPRCGFEIKRGDPMVRQGGNWIHVECASGQDEE